MKTISFLWDTACVEQSKLHELNQKVTHSIEKLQQTRHHNNYQTPQSSINCAFDKNIPEQVTTHMNAKKKLNPRAMVIVGIGGSNLGTQAIYEALYGKEGNPEFPLYFADTVDSDYITGLLKKIEYLLQDKQTVLLTLISKSGSTTESIANFECFLQLLKKYHPTDYIKNVIIITDENSKLWNLAGDYKFDRLPIPALVGGRYSVFSAVGLFPLACTGIDINQLLLGAQTIARDCLDSNRETNPAARSATIIAYHYFNNTPINDLFIFNVALESIGKWYRQLMGESIGKEINIFGKKVNIGITPTVSIGSTDLHSVGQLYLGGPFDKFTTFIWIEKNNHTVTIPAMPEYETLVPHIQGKSLAQVMNAIFRGVQKAYINNNRPFITITMPEKNAYYIGQLLQLQMIQMMYLGALLDVNPFDQPEVELYKEQTRKILKYE